ncbi:TPA: accessory colonization factor AcfC, partial [Campylobacter jejuni]|nr:accessory colonization factor AcfC [Campylobacter jejuni]
MKKIITLFGACALAFSMANADVNLYGPGGPHTALKDIANKYSEKTGVKVNVNFG